MCTKCRMRRTNGGTYSNSIVVSYDWWIWAQFRSKIGENVMRIRRCFCVCHFSWAFRQQRRLLDRREPVKAAASDRSVSGACVHGSRGAQRCPREARGGPAERSAARRDGVARALWSSARRCRPRQGRAGRDASHAAAAAALPVSLEAGDRGDKMERETRRRDATRCRSRCHGV